MEPDEEVIDDIMFKFVYNLGEEYMSNPVQLLFQIERAWWYYEDTVRAQKSYKHYPSYGAFTLMLADKVPLLKNLLGDPNEALNKYREFKTKIPVYGAILMDKDMERVLLVRGQAASSGWGFPRGKINAGESEVDCAAREVLEETGCNIEHLINPKAYIEARGSNDKVHKLFIVVGVDPETTAFAPQLAGEVGAYSWHWLCELPANTRDADTVYRLTRSGDNQTGGSKVHRFYMVTPFVGRLRAWVSEKRRQLGMAPPSWDTSAAATAAQAAAAGARAPIMLGASKDAAPGSGGASGASGTPQQSQRRQGGKGGGKVRAEAPAGADAAGSSGAAAVSAATVPAAAGLQSTQTQQRRGNFVLSSAFAFDTDAILRCLL